MRIAVYPGSFDPLHIGHRAILEYLTGPGGFDCTYLIVSPQNPFKDAAKYFQNYISRKFGLFTSSYNIVDGCGLSMYDMFSPQFMVDMLTLIYRDSELYPILYKCLPISGVDGTLKTRLNDKTTLNKVHAKTGSVTGSCTLAGYIHTADGRDLAFCIMNEGAVKMAPSRVVQDKICKALCELGL